MWKPRQLVSTQFSNSFDSVPPGLLKVIVTNWIGLTLDNGLLLMRDRSLQEIYALDLRFR